MNDEISSELASGLDFEEHERIIGRKVKLLREERGWSQSELATRLRELGLDLHQTTVAKMEAGRRPLRVSEAVAIAQAMKLPPNAFFWLPVPGEDRSLAQARDELAKTEQSAEAASRTLLDVVETFAQNYAMEISHLRAMTELVNHMARVESASPEDRKDVAAQMLDQLNSEVPKRRRKEPDA